jgi:serine protease Do
MEENMKKLISLLVGLILATLIVRYQPEDKFVNPIKKVMPAVVEIHVTGYIPHPIAVLIEAITGDPITNDPESWIKVRILGSGVYVNAKGYILTCAHLFNGFKKIDSISVINIKDDTVSGQIVSIGDKVDLAVIKTTYYTETPFVKLADPRKLKVGQDVFAIGSPLGLSFSVTSGIISALYRDFDHAYNVTQSDVSINPGNSGGPLFNIKGELVGINSFMIPPVNAAIFTGLGFSVQVGQCLEFLVQTGRKDKELRNKKWINLLYRWL